MEIKELEKELRGFGEPVQLKVSLERGVYRIRVGSWSHYKEVFGEDLEETLAEALRRKDLS